MEKDSISMSSFDDVGQLFGLCLIVTLNAVIEKLSIYLLCF